MCPEIKLTDPRLFGNDVAEDEREDVFLAHVLEREELVRFSSPDERICVVRAYKGEGKSALLRLCRVKIQGTAESPLVISTPAYVIAPSGHETDFAQWIRAWKESMVGRIAAELGTQIGLAWRDDTMSLVEEAEKAGLRERGLIGTILSRLKPTISYGGAEISAAGSSPGTQNPEALVQRWTQGKSPIWLFLDDIDQNFENTPEFRARVAACFVAARELCNSIPELRIRAAVRPNVWTTVKMQFEALSHLEQYIIDLSWSEAELRDLLAKRIKGYLELTGQQSNVSGSYAERSRSLISLAFQDPMEWGRENRPPHVLVATLSKYRPRWMVELCKAAALRASKEGKTRIGRDHLVQELAGFGRRRIEDTIAEFSSQCSEVGELIAAFRQEPEQMSTAELLRIINKKILTHVHPRIVGVIGAPSARDVAAFLFQVGFFFGRQDFPDGSYRHITYSERPHLFASRTSLDDGLSWEVHPIFRQVLEMRDSSGAEIRRPNQKRRR